MISALLFQIITRYFIKDWEIFNWLGYFLLLLEKSIQRSERENKPDGHEPPNADSQQCRNPNSQQNAESATADFCERHVKPIHFFCFFV